MKKHVLICYRNGYGGDFFSTLLDNALGNKRPYVKDNGTTNRYKFSNEENSFNSNLKALSYFFHLVRNDMMDKKVETFKFDPSFSTHVQELQRYYNVAYDDDRSEFYQNLADLIGEVDRDKDYVVTNIHYHRPEPGFSIWRIKHDIVPLLLTAADTKQLLLFRLLGAYKVNWNTIINQPSSVKESMDLNPIEAFDSMTPVDVGKLFFEDDNENEIERILTDAIETPVHLDRRRIAEYKRENHSVLTSLLGNDYPDIKLGELRGRLKKIYQSRV